MVVYLKFEQKICSLFLKPILLFSEETWSQFVRRRVWQWQHRAFGWGKKCQRMQCLQPNIIITQLKWKLYPSVWSQWNPPYTSNRLFSTMKMSNQLNSPSPIFSHQYDDYTTSRSGLKLSSLALRGILYFERNFYIL